MQNLFRRGGMWWTRLVVPEKLRVAAGRREFSQSCRTHELEIAKLVASVLLAQWRKLILGIQSRPMTRNVLKIVDGAPELTSGGWITLGDATRLSGIEREHFLREAADGDLQLFARLSRVDGYAVPTHDLELVDPPSGTSGGIIVPQPDAMPASAIELIQNGLMALDDSAVIAGAVLSQRLKSVELVSFAMADRPGWLFAPNASAGLNIEVDQLHVLTSAVEGIRVRMKATVSEDTIGRLVEIQRAAAVNEGPIGNGAKMLFSEALAEYAKDANGIAGQVVSATTQQQKRRGCQLFIELIGDLPLHQVTTDQCRTFREKLKGVPNKTNNIKKEYRRETNDQTVAALKAAGQPFEMMTENARHERMLWIHQMFRWVVTREYLKENPMSSVLGEQTKTAAERKVESQARALKKALGADDSDDREPFTPAELITTFSQSTYTTGNGTHVSGNGRWYPFEYWLPLIALHAGCRIKEVSQLYLSDLRQVDDVWCFDINEVSADKSLKNDNATRLIPVAPFLIECGLLEYRERLQAAGYKRLFPELSWSISDAKYAKESKRKMSGMFAGLGMPRDGSKVFHCLRANFNNALLRVTSSNLTFDDPDLKKYIRLKAMGHKVEGVNEEHYTNTTMREKLSLVACAEFGLPNIAKFDVSAGVTAVQNAINWKNGFRRGREDMGACNNAIYGTKN